MAINLSKQQELGSDSKALHKISFIRNLYQYRNEIMFCVIQEAKEAILNFSQRYMRLL